MNKLKLVDVYESKLYQEDHDFKNEDEKDAYYNGDFLYNGDYILIKGISYSAVQVDDEIIISGELEIDLTDDERNKIIAFYTDELFDQYKATGQFIELSTWPHEIKESNEAMNKAPLAIKYRGGQGYNYGWWLLNK